jgi:hypothetical protein
VAKNYAERAVYGDAPQIPAARVSLADLHVRSQLQGVVLQRLGSPKDAIYLQLLRDSNGEMAANGKVKQVILVNLIKLLKTCLEDKVVEEFVHC